MGPRRKIAVAGATGRVGRHIVDILGARGHEVVRISRSSGVDIITRAGLADALSGVERIIDASNSSSTDEKSAREFFTTSARNLQEVGAQARVQGIDVVSIIGCDRFSSGYLSAKFAHERALRSGPIPVRVLRASQFHELVPQMVEWGRRGDVSYVPRMRTQPIAAMTVAESLAGLAIGPEPGAAQESDGAWIPEIAGPREETLFDMAKLLAARRGDPARIEVGTDPADPDAQLYEEGALLPGPHAILAGPTFEGWLGSVWGRAVA